MRYGNFAGGLVNAVTRSGSNRWEGSVSSYFQNESLTGKDSAGNRAEDFSTRELTVTLAGPIVRDHAAFFLDAGLQRFVGARGPSIGTDTTGGADSAGNRYPPGRLRPLPGHSQEHLPCGSRRDRSRRRPEIPRETSSPRSRSGRR